MTVNELIEMLEDIASDGNGDKEVKFVTDYGDYYHTQQALDVNGGWDNISVKKSGYSQSGYEAIAGDDCIGICLDGGSLDLPKDDDEDEDCEE